MNRRSFLKKTVPAVVSTSCIVMAGFDWFMEENPDYTPFVETLNDYNDYSNFSMIAINESMEKFWSDAAAEISRRAGLSVSALAGETNG